MKNKKLKKVKLSITDFALPAPRKGSIDSNSGFGRGTQTGIEIHQRVQTEKLRLDPSYKAEVIISQTFEREDYLFEISGRIDGLFERENPKIEEIKSGFNIHDLARQLRDTEEDHPYCLQLKTYGYFYHLQNQKIPELNMHLVSSRNFESLDLEMKLNLKVYEAWLELRLLELVGEARIAEKRSVRRKKASGNLQFPFLKPRSGQVELIETIQQTMKEDRPMLIQAPTGSGKTIGVLYPTLQEALSRGQKVIYVTPKNSQHSVAEEAIEKMQEKGAAIKSMTLTAKSKMCFKNEPICNPEFCEFAKDHYTKVAENNLLADLAKKRSLTERTFKKMAEENQVCPFELQLAAVTEADAIICDYNYVFAPRALLSKSTGLALDQEGLPNLVIDEAHNLPARSMDYYSPMLSTFILERMRDDLNALPKKFRKDARELLDECIQVVRASGPKNCQKSLPINHR